MLPYVPARNRPQRNYNSGAPASPQWGSGAPGQWGRPPPVPQPHSPGETPEDTTTQGVLGQFGWEHGRPMSPPPDDDLNDHWRGAEYNNGGAWGDGESGEFLAPVPDNDATRVPYAHYIRLYRIWIKKQNRYVPYDPATYTPPPVEENTDIYFHIEERYEAPDVKPTSIITQWSPVLLKALRPWMGGKFFAADATMAVTTLLPKIKKLRKLLSAVKEALSPDSSMSLDDKAKLSRCSGLVQPSDGGPISELQVKEYLSELVKQMSVLMEYLEEQFKPIAERLEFLAGFNRIEYDLLEYIFEAGQIVTTKHPSGEPIAWEINYTTTSKGLLGAFQVHGSGLLWDGHEFVRYDVNYPIPAFAGVRNLSELPIQHLDDETMEYLKARGRVYTEYSGVHYRLYKGQRVIVDRKGWSNQMGYVQFMRLNTPTLDEQFLHFLPPDVFGFNLATKQWSIFDLDELRPVIFDDGAWDHLVLDPDVKTLIKGLVDVTKNANANSGIISDVITGKGGGLIAVLHGPPGTGKTLTAEAVAEILRRPLYVVGSSELPQDPPKLEEKLSGILSLATAWDAVLLIDEADVFLEQRSLHELERNALVSVVLRMLEYHKGVLFLTTNRLKAFDRAFLSRFSIAIKYPDLDDAGRFTIWSKFLELANCRVVAKNDLTPYMTGAVITREDLHELSSKPFNGRTIKNLVRTAQALALSAQETLAVEHIRVVVRAQEKFLNDFATSEQ